MDKFYALKMFFSEHSLPLYVYMCKLQTPRKHVWLEIFILFHI